MTSEYPSHMQDSPERDRHSPLALTGQVRIVGVCGFVEIECPVDTAIGYYTAIQGLPAERSLLFLVQRNPVRLAQDRWYFGPVSSGILLLPYESDEFKKPRLASCSVASRSKTLSRSSFARITRGGAQPPEAIRGSARPGGEAAIGAQEPAQRRTPSPLRQRAALGLHNPNNLLDTRVILSHFVDALRSYPPSTELAKGFLARFADRAARSEVAGGNSPYKMAFCDWSERFG